MKFTRRAIIMLMFVLLFWFSAEAQQEMVRWTLAPIVYGVEYPVVFVMLFLFTGVVLVAGRKLIVR